MRESHAVLDMAGNISRHLVLHLFPSFSWLQWLGRRRLLRWRSRLRYFAKLLDDLLELPDALLNVDMLEGILDFLDLVLNIPDGDLIDLSLVEGPLIACLEILDHVRLSVGNGLVAIFQQSDPHLECRQLGGKECRSFNWIRLR